MAEPKVEVPIDMYEVLTDLSAPWKKKASLVTQASDKRYRKFETADAAIKAMGNDMCTLIAEEHDTEFPVAGGLSCFMGRLGMFLAKHWRTSSFFQLLGVAGNKMQFDAVMAVMAVLGFKLKIENEDRRGVQAWVWEFSRPAGKVVAELLLFESTEKASVSRLEQAIGYKESHNETPNLRKIVVVTVPEKQDEEFDLYHKLRRAIEKSIERGVSKGFMPEEPFTGIGDTKANVAYITYFDGDPAQLGKQGKGKK